LYDVSYAETKSRKFSQLKVCGGVARIYKVEKNMHLHVYSEFC